ncbi:MAG: hypothetical protein JRG91_16510, partial [Deltaproteobacteria bacterium]|nr:hypothetical protein [Deltaproteobacteria bacterium]
MQIHRILAAGAAALTITCGPKAVEEPRPAVAPAPMASGQCAANADCAPGLTCAQGKCVQPRVVDAAGCRSDAQCGPGGRCESGKCVGGTPGVIGTLEGTPFPQPPTGIGYSPPPMPGCMIDADCSQGKRCHKGFCQSASGKSLGATCGMPEECAYGLDCLDGRCVRRYVLGQPCLFDSDCGDFDFCVGNLCAKDLAKVGQPCKITMDCDSDIDLTVCLQGTCSFLGNGGQGQVCEFEEDCNPPLVCNAYRCGNSYAQMGQTCFDDSHCAPPMY